jgi:hypothetical protein
VQQRRQRQQRARVDPGAAGWQRVGVVELGRLLGNGGGKRAVGRRIRL